jgi:hypothetical protein
MPLYPPPPKQTLEQRRDQIHDLCRRLVVVAGYGDARVATVVNAVHGSCLTRKHIARLRAVFDWKPEIGPKPRKRRVSLISVVARGNQAGDLSPRENFL